MIDYGLFNCVSDARDAPRPGHGHRGPSMLVRETAVRELDERRTDWGYSKPVVALDMMWNTAFVVVSVVMLILTRDERPNTPIRLWICGYALQCFVHVALVWVEYRRRTSRRGRRTAEAQQSSEADANESDDEAAMDLGAPIRSRGKVLKDDHPLSEYHLENGHTLHLVVRQPSQPQTSSGTSSAEPHANIGNEGSGAPRGRIGQVSHSVVLGTFNVGDQGESMAPDLSRVIGAVLNSIGIGNQAATNVTSNIQSTMV